jgi:type IV secretory pathway VirB10-like protein
MTTPDETPQPRLRLWVPIVGTALGLLVVATLVLLPTLVKLLPVPSLASLGEPEAPQTTVKLPETFARPQWTYGTPEPPPLPPPEPPKPPIAEYVSRGMPPSPPVPVQQAALLPNLNPFASAPPASAPPAPAQAPTTAPEKPVKKSWDFQARGKGKEGQTAPPEGKKPELLAKGDTEQLIHRAKWEIPINPLKTLYRSMLLPGRTLDAIDSSIPGMVRIILTTPIYDKFNYNEEILAKGSIIIATQSAKPGYGSNRLEIKIDQIETPSGEVIALKANVGDANGAQGLTGKVSANYGKLIMAAGLSAILNIGARGVVGEPRGFQPSIGQEAARDFGAGIQRDAQSVIDRELRVQPTIAVPPGVFCTIGLLENLQFNHAPHVVR